MPDKFENATLYTEFIKPGASMESRRDRTGQKNTLLSCPIPHRLHARSRLYEFGVLLRIRLPSTLIRLYPHKKIRENGTF